MNMLDIENKKSLCTKIARAYRDVFLLGMNQACWTPSKLARDLSLGGNKQILEKHREQNGLITIVDFLRMIRYASRFEDEAEKYENLANSMKLYLVRKSKLETILVELPVKQRPKTFVVQECDDKHYRIKIM